MFLYGRECADQHDLLVAILLAAGGSDAELMKPAGWTGRIADVVFEGEDTWIFEVKSLEVDRPSDPLVQSKIGEGLTLDAVRFGGPIGFGRNRVDVSTLPEETGRNLMRTIGRSVQKAVDEANRQIKATKTALSTPDAKGCIALISPPHELSPKAMCWLINDALRGGRNSSINCAMVAQTPMLAPFGQFENGSSYAMFAGLNGVYVPDWMKRKIGRKWAAAHGQPARESTLDEIDGLVQASARS